MDPRSCPGAIFHRAETGARPPTAPPPCGWTSSSATSRKRLQRKQHAETRASRKSRRCEERNAPGGNMKKPLLVLATALVAFTDAAHGAEPPFPNKPIRVIIPTAPGGGSDATMRM